MTTATEPMASIPEVAISVIHDFRNPLATIRGSSEILIRSGLFEPQIQRIARNVQGASIRMQQLIEEFLEQYRGAQRKPELTDLRELATNAVDRIAYRAVVKGWKSCPMEEPSTLARPLSPKRF